MCLGLNFRLSPQLAEAQEDIRGLQQRVESLQRDKQRLEGELEEAERLLKVAKARHVKQGAAREEGKESKVTAAYLCCYVPRNYNYGLLEMGKVSHCPLVVCTVTSIETVWLIWDGESVPVTVGYLAKAGGCSVAVFFFHVHKSTETIWLIRDGEGGVETGYQ